MYSAAEESKLVKNTYSSSHNWSYRNPWFHTSCKDAKKEYRKALRLCKKGNFTSKLRQDAVLCKSRYRELCRVKRKDYIQAPSKLRSLKFPPLAGTTSTPQYTSRELHHHFCLIQYTNESLDAEISLYELDSVLSLLKPGKAAGPDILPNELYKALTGQHKEMLRTLFNKEGVLPDCQLGFRKGRSCTDAIFTLLSAIQIQFRHNDGREIYGIFVDFQRALDSVPHARLWEKLQTVKIGSKFISIIKSLYDQATMQGYSNEFEVSEGVLQGESLSPDLFLLYLYDIKQFFRGKGLYGLDINGITDILLLLYADDTVIFAHSHIDLRRKLKALEQYCDLNGLTVNQSKTKILVFKAAGRIKECPNHFRTYKQTCLELVKNYTYLGINVSTSAKGLTALKTALNKAKCASGASLSLLARAKCDSWDAYNKIFDSMVASVFLYAFPAWGLWYRNSLEPVQTLFFKKLFNLPRNTPDWAVRLEFGLKPVAVRALSCVLRWTIKTLKANDECLHKIYLLRLYHLAQKTTTASPYNWVSQLRELLTECGEAHLLDSLDPLCWEIRMNAILESYSAICRSKDVSDAERSKSLELYTPSLVRHSPANYLLLNIPFASKRIIVQIRLSNKHNCFLNTGKNLVRFNPSSFCQLCNSPVPDTIEHLLVTCPMFTGLRNHYLLEPLQEHGNITEILKRINPFHKHLK
ncbi:Similar to jockey\pol: RNA-directed DNA polymerase from mobile element jockey (Drosophila funebris) [Cotesia congregata]|uniref:Similar to jockey\pol: RNA-directed DNA polymerase from mobile element jockey (Drosophila funebris) n=1 Tax=Cotesia congregata TaxID=51543 RepID=A0A8J2HIW0_COTCN|nr:Similar to jockey\pol: RNA-directed DNA polymerase from mobile element jockey (Drosophila funebris) [Cotesia congregata]